MNPRAVQSAGQLVLRLILGATFLAYSFASLAIAISSVLRRVAGDR
jgi:hypothetical protein